MKPYDVEPTSAPEVFDMIHGLFGIGDFDPDMDSDPWYRFRLTEIAKIKSIAKKRRWTWAEFAMVARYCSRHDIRVSRTWDLLAHWGPAKAEERTLDLQRREAEVRDAIATERASGLPDSEEWAVRLELSTGRGREELLEEWKAGRQRTLAPP